MQKKGNSKPTATKIKKWVEAATELSSNYTGFALPITRLTSIKSMCREDVTAAEKFALYLSKLVLQQASSAVRSEVSILLEVAEFWYQHYFEESSREKFPYLVED